MQQKQRRNQDYLKRTRYPNNTVRITLIKCPVCEADLSDVPTHQHIETHSFDELISTGRR